MCGRLPSAIWPCAARLRNGPQGSSILPPRAGAPRPRAAVVYAQPSGGRCLTAPGQHPQPGTPDKSQVLKPCDAGAEAVALVATASCQLWLQPGFTAVGPIEGRTPACCLDLGRLVQHRVQPRHSDRQRAIPSWPAVDVRWRLAPATGEPLELSSACLRGRAGLAYPLLSGCWMTVGGLPQS